MGDGWNILYRSMLAGCRSMLGVRGFRILGFRIPNSVWGMGVREILARGRRDRTSRVSPGRTLDVLWGRAERKEGSDRRDTGSGQRKTPQGEPYGGEGRLANLSVPGDGRKRHEEHEESAKQEVSQGAE